MKKKTFSRSSVPFAKKNSTILFILWVLMYIILGIVIGILLVLY